MSTSLREWLESGGPAKRKDDSHSLCRTEMRRRRLACEIKTFPLRQSYISATITVFDHSAPVQTAKPSIIADRQRPRRRQRARAVWLSQRKVS